MITDSMNNSITTDNHPSAEQHPHDNHQQGENLTQNHAYSEADIQVAKKEKESRHTSTHLYISLYFLLNHHNEYNVSLGNIHVGQDIELQQLSAYLLCSQV